MSNYYDDTMRMMNIFLIVMALLFLLVISVAFISMDNQKVACERQGYDYNWNAECIDRQLDGTIIKYDLSPTEDVFSLKYYVNKFPSVE